MTNTNEVAVVIEKTLQERIMIFDGGMGTMIQNLQFEEEDFRGIININITYNNKPNCWKR